MTAQDLLFLILTFLLGGEKKSDQEVVKSYPCFEKAMYLCGHSFPL